VSRPAVALLAVAAAGAVVVAGSCVPAQPVAEVLIVPGPSAWIEDPGVVLLAAQTPEPDPYRTHGRVELSLLDEKGREAFRALYNASSRANPVPPEAFGVVDLDAGTTESAGIEGEWEVDSGGFALVPDSVTVRRDGWLTVSWALRPAPSVEGSLEVRARVVPEGADTAPWRLLGTLVRDAAGWRFREASGPAPGVPGPMPEPYAAMIASGRAVEVVRGAEEMWVRGVAPETIDAVRARALDAIAARGSFSTGDEVYAVDGIREVAEWLTARPDVLGYRVETAGDLPPERLLALAVAVGRPHSTAAGAGSEWALPDIDPAAAVRRTDPWVVSAALFLARKQGMALDAGAVLERWRGPWPWDAECARQARLYVAGAPWAAALLDGAEPEELPDGLASLEAARPGVVEILPWAFRSSDRWGPALEPVEPEEGFELLTLDSTMEPIGRRPATGAVTTLELPPTGNSYQLQVSGGPLRGESRFIQGHGGAFVRLAVPLRDPG